MDFSQVATALLTEHLQYTPLSLIDDIIDSVNNLVYQGVGSLESGLFATPPERLGFKPAPQNGSENAEERSESQEARQEIEEGLHKLETLLNSTVDKNFDKFEIYVLRNIMAVPQDLVNWIKLSHYEKIQYPLPPDAPTSETIELLRQKLTASRNITQLLRREERRNEVILAQLKKMMGSVVEASSTPNFSFLASSDVVQAFGNQSQQPLTTNTTFTLSQLPALKSVLAELRGQLTILQTSPPTSLTAKDELREERRGYIEQRTRSQLEKNGPAAMNDVGEIGGRSMDPIEIEALEKVAGMLNQG